MPSAQDLIADLNPPQREAVTTTEGPVLVVAGAGSGKTRVITRRIAYLIAEGLARPGEIFAATFTNKAAREMKHRVAQMLEGFEADRLPVATFHSHCATILRREAAAAGLTSRYAICDDKDQKALLRDCIQRLGHNPKYLTPGDASEAISLAKMKLLEGAAARDYLTGVRSEEYGEIYALYEKRLRESDAVDFDDLLLLTVKLWDEHPDILRKYRERFRHLLIDEYQDTNMAQFEIVRRLSEEHRRLCAVGDEDQSIYSWRGAEITNLLEFQNHFPEARIIRLEQNYRSVGNVLEAAGALIARNTQRLGKELWTERPPGDPIVVVDAQSEHDEARKIVGQIRDLRAGGLPLSEIAIFYRVNALSRVYEDALREANIPYRVVGGLRFYDRAEIKDLLAYLQVLANPANTLALMRIVNTPRRGIGTAALTKLVQYAEAERLTLFEALLEEKRVKAAGLKGKAAKGAKELGDLFVRWTAESGRKSVLALVEDILKATDYEAALGDPKAIEVMSRIDNIREFLGALEQFEDAVPDASLQEYLESVALKGADEENAQAQTGVSLMTVHNAKGLEFDVVFIVAMEKNLFPNARAVRDQGHKEEERRLFYVALTRARKRLYLSHATTRRLYGQTEWPSPSLFLYEIPQELCQYLDDADLGPVEPEPRTPQAGEAPTPAKPPRRPDAPPKPRKRYAHDVLGEIEVLEESGEGPGRRMIVRTRAGTEHTVFPAHANLQPLGETSAAADSKAAPPDEEDDGMPF